jgi:hypothetical protein
VTSIQSAFSRWSAELVTHLFALLRRPFRSAALRSVLSQNFLFPSVERIFPMPIRTFSLNSEEAHEILCGPPSGAPRWERRPAPVMVMGQMESEGGGRRWEHDVQAEAEDAFKEWQWHVEEGRVG